MEMIELSGVPRSPADAALFSKRLLELTRAPMRERGLLERDARVGGFTGDMNVDCAR